MPCPNTSSSGISIVDRARTRQSGQVFKVRFERNEGTDSVDAELCDTGKTYSTGIAPSPKEIYAHSKKAGLPCNKVSLIKVVIDPSTAEPG